MAQQQRFRAALPSRDGERGFVLLLVIFLVALVLIAFAIAAPKWKSAIQRDQELELKHRGMQYARGVKLYYKKFGSYPTSLQQLMTGSQMTGNIGFSSGSGSQPGQQRFIRRLYNDPITGQPKWRLVYYGQIGMFSNTCGGTDASTAMTGSLATQTQQNQATGTDSTASGTNAATTGDCSQTAANGQNGTNGSSPSSMFGNSSGSSSSSGFGSGSSSGFGSGSSFGSSSGSSFGGSGSGFGSSSSGFGSSFGSPGTDPNAAVGSTTTPGFGSTPGGTGLPIVGVASMSAKHSIMEIKGKSRYNELEFVYDPTQDFGGMGGMSGTSVGGATTNSSPFGGQNSLGSGFSSPGGLGGSSPSSFGNSGSSGSGTSGGSTDGNNNNGSGNNNNNGNGSNNNGNGSNNNNGNPPNQSQ